MNLDHWCNHCYRGMRYYAARKTQQPEKIQDLTQEVFFKFARTWKPEMETWAEEQIWAWLLKILCNCFIDLGRREALRPHISLDEVQGAYWPQETEKVALINVALHEAMTSIGEKRAKLLMDYYGADLTTAEFAQLMDMPPAKAIARVYRARDAFREAYRG